MGLGDKLLHFFVPQFISKVRIMTVLPHRAVVKVECVRTGKDRGQCLAPNCVIVIFFFVEVRLLCVSVICHRKTPGPQSDVRGGMSFGFDGKTRLAHTVAESLTSPKATANQEKASRIPSAGVSLIRDWPSSVSSVESTALADFARDGNARGHQVTAPRLPPPRCGWGLPGPRKFGGPIAA